MVDLVDQAGAQGRRGFRAAQDLGFLYGRAFGDLDGHIREILSMHPSHVQA